MRFNSIIGCVPSRIVNPSEKTLTQVGPVYWEVVATDVPDRVSGAAGRINSYPLNSLVGFSNLHALPIKTLESHAQLKFQ